MIKSKRKLLGGKIIAKHKVKFKALFPASCDRSDSIVRYAICIRKNHCRLISVCAPGRKNLVCKLYKPILFRVADSNNGHRPFYYRCLDILKSRKADFCLLARKLHWENVATALHMIVRKNRSTNDGEVSIRADKIMGKFGNEAEKLCKALAVYSHRLMLCGKGYTMLIIVNVGRIL